MKGTRAGGYEFATVAENTDILPTIKSNELAIFTDTPLNKLQDISFVPTSGDCHIKINGGTTIFCKQNVGYSNDIWVNTSFVIVESGVAFYMAYNWD